MLKFLRKLLKWTVGSLLSLILLAIVLGYIFQDKIHLLAIKELGRTLHARIEVRETSVSFLSSFPHVEVQLEGLTLNPIDSKDPRDVISVEKASFKINFWSFFSNEMKISAVNLYRPEVFLMVNEQGEWNMGDMFSPPSTGDSTVSKDSSALVFALSKVHTYGGSFELRDDQRGDFIRIDSLNIGLDGDFSDRESDFHSLVDCHLHRWKSGGMTLARSTHISSDVTVDAQYANGERYDLKKAQLKIASLLLDLKGHMRTEGDHYQVDLEYATNRNSFESFMSLLPGGFLQTGREYIYDGLFNLNGWLKGPLSDRQFPDFFAKYAVQNGSFQYKGYKSRLSDVQMAGTCLVHQRQPKLSHFKVDKFKAKLNERQVVGDFSYKDFFDPRLSMAFSGLVGLQEIRDFYPAFADKSEVSGAVALDLKAEGRLADFEKENFFAITASGEANLDSVSIQDPRLPRAIENIHGKIRIDNSRIVVDRLTGKVGTSDFDIHGNVGRYLSYIFKPNGTLVARLQLKSKKIDLNEWMATSQPDNSTSSPTASSSAYTYSLQLPPGLDLLFDTEVGDFSFGDFQAEKARGKAHLQGQQINLQGLYFKALGGQMQMSGKVQLHNPKSAFANIDAVFTNVDINRTFRTFDQLAAFALVEESLTGIFSGNVHIEGRMNEQLVFQEQSLLAHGTVELKNGRLANFEPLEALAGFIKVDKLKDLKFSDINTTFRIEDGFFYIPGLELLANEYKMKVKGKHGFDNSLDYHLALTLPQKEARKSRNTKVRDLIEVKEAESPEGITIPVRITGTVDHPKFRIDGGFVKENVKVKIAHQKEELKTGFQTEVQEVFGKQDTSDVDDWIDVAPKDNTEWNPKKIWDKVKGKNPFRKKDSIPE